MGRSLCALGTLLALAGVAGAHSARGATWGGERPAEKLRAAHTLGFVSAARLCAGPLAGSAATCRYRGARPAVPQRGAALPGVMPAVRARDTLRLLSLSAVGAGGKDEDEWNSYAMLEDSDSEESLDDQAMLPEAPSAPASAVVSSAPALEDDPRAVHMPAVEDDTSILQGSAFGQVCSPQVFAALHPIPDSSYTLLSTSRGLSLSHSLSLALSRSLSLALSRSLSLSLSRALSLSLTLALFLPPSLSLPLSLSFPPSLSLSLSARPPPPSNTDGPTD